MQFMRVSLLTPKQDTEQTVAKITDQLLKAYAQQPGYITGYKIRSAGEDGQIGRVTVWRSAADADATAQQPHVLALRSELQPLIEEGSHAEPSYYAAGPDEPLVV